MQHQPQPNQIQVGMIEEESGKEEMGRGELCYSRPPKQTLCNSPLQQQVPQPLPSHTHQQHITQQKGKLPIQQVNIDHASARGEFTCATIDGINVPCLFRKNEKYIVTRMVELKVLSKFPSEYPDEVKNSSRLESCYITSSEASLLNEINQVHYNYEYGTQPFTKKDIVVKLADFEQFFKMVKKHFYDKKVARSIPDVEGGWLQINNTVVPYILRDTECQVPLSVIKYAAGLLTNVPVQSSTASNEECDYLNKSCKIAGCKFTFTKTTKLVTITTLLSRCSNPIELQNLPKIKPFSHAEYKEDMPHMGEQLPGGYQIQHNTVKQLGPIPTPSIMDIPEHHIKPEYMAIRHAGSHVGIMPGLQGQHMVKLPNGISHRTSPYQRHPYTPAYSRKKINNSTKTVMAVDPALTSVGHPRPDKQPQSAANHGSEECEGPSGQFQHLVSPGSEECNGPNHQPHFGVSLGSPESKGPNHQSVVSPGSQEYEGPSGQLQHVVSPGSEESEGTSGQPQSVISSGSQECAGPNHQSQFVFSIGSPECKGPNHQPQSVVSPGSQECDGSNHQPQSVVSSGSQECKGPSGQPHSVVSPGSQECEGPSAQHQSVVSPGSQECEGPSGQPQSVVSLDSPECEGPSAQPQSVVSLGSEGFNALGSLYQYINYTGLESGGCESAASQHLSNTGPILCEDPSQLQAKEIQEHKHFTSISKLAPSCDTETHSPLAPRAAHQCPPYLLQGLHTSTPSGSSMLHQLTPLTALSQSQNTTYIQSSTQSGWNDRKCNATMSCNVKEASENQYALLKCVAHTYFPNHQIKELQFAIEHFPGVPIRELTAAEEKIFITHNGLPARPLSCNKIVKVKDVVDNLSQLNDMLNEQATYFTRQQKEKVSISSRIDRVNIHHHLQKCESLSLGTLVVNSVTLSNIPSMALLSMDAICANSSSMSANVHPRTLSLAQVAANSVTLSPPDRQPMNLSMCNMAANSTTSVQSNLVSIDTVVASSVMYSPNTHSQALSIGGPRRKNSTASIGSADSGILSDCDITIPQITSNNTWGSTKRTAEEDLEECPPTKLPCLMPDGDDVINSQDIILSKDQCNTPPRDSSQFVEQSVSSWSLGSPDDYTIVHIGPTEDSGDINTHNNISDNINIPHDIQLITCKPSIPGEEVTLPLPSNIPNINEKLLSIEEGVDINFGNSVIHRLDNILANIKKRHGIQPTARIPADNLAASQPAHSATCPNSQGLRQVLPTKDENDIMINRLDNILANINALLK